MTQQQKLKEVVEATGGCWHLIYIEPHEESLHDEVKSTHCTQCYLKDVVNPSPSDLNALFDLAEKLGLPDPDFITGFGTKNVELIDEYQRKFVGTGSTPAEALLNALHEAVKK